MYIDEGIKNLIQDIIAEILEEKKKKINPKYLTKDKAAMRKEIGKHAEKDPSDASAYTSHSKGGWKADYTKSGKKYKTKKSKWTKKFEKMYGESVENAGETVEDFDLQVLREFISEAILTEKKKRKGGNVTTALKNKAKKTGAPMSALRAIYNKGLAAWRTGHRPGVSQHQWAMGRVNSVLAGGPARKIDAAQWKQIQKARKKKKK